MLSESQDIFKELVFEVAPDSASGKEDHCYMLKEGDSIDLSQFSSLLNSD